MAHAKIYGLAARMHHGKDTFYGFVAGQYKHVYRVAFADALKHEVAAACEVTVEFIEQNKETFRPILQWWGTDFRRKLFGDDYWLRKLAVTLESFSVVDVVFITDVRFENEAQFVRDRSGKVIRLVRSFYQDTDHSQHASETSVEAIVPDLLIVARNTDQLMDQAVQLGQQEKFITKC